MMYGFPGNGGPVPFDDEHLDDIGEICAKFATTQFLQGACMFRGHNMFCADTKLDKLAGIDLILPTCGLISSEALSLAQYSVYTKP